MKKWKCSVCGYIHEDEERPEKCPLCGAGAEMFIEVVEEKPAEDATEDAASEPAPMQVQGKTRKWKCKVCNYTCEGEEPPEKCPVCGADRSMFVEVTEEIADSAPEPAAAAEAAAEKLTEAGPGKEAEAKDRFGILGRLIMEHHLHPITVHTPNGVVPMAIVFLLLSMLSGYAALELASWFSLVFVLLTMPAVAFTGYVAWQVKYKGISTGVFKTKLACAIIVAVVLTLMICWRLIDKTVPLAGTTESWIYFGLGCVGLIAAGIAGHLGGKLVFSK